MGNLLAKTSQKPIQPLPTRDVYICGSHVIWKAEISYHPELHFGSYLIILLLQVTRFWLILDPYISLAAFHHPRIALRLVTPSSRWEASSSRSSRSLPISRGLLLWRIIYNRSITDSDSSRNSQKKIKKTRTPTKSTKKNLKIPSQNSKKKHLANHPRPTRSAFRQRGLLCVEALSTWGVVAAVTSKKGEWNLVA